MTIQEMFDKAYIGLASQGFERCCDSNRKICLYSNGNGHHCAWGWVDLSLLPEQCGHIQDLYEDGIGIAASLNEEQLYFAQRLQDAHDGSIGPADMKISIERLARHCNLTIPKID